MISRITVLLILCCFWNISAQPLTTHYTQNNVGYLKYVPSVNSIQDSLPILLFLHGIDERGGNLQLVKRHGPPKLIDQGNWPKDLPFIVISPQLPLKYDYWPVNLIDDIIDHVIRSNDLNTTRIFITGFSMGGIGTWNYAIKRPEKVAAIIPICGKGEPESACKMQNIPVWAFHGDQDNIILPGGSIKMIEALKNCTNRNSKDTKLTIYKNVKHDSWTATYSNNKIYQWLLTHLNSQSANIKNHSNNDHQNSLDFKVLCELPIALREISGLLYDSNGILWAHNDSGHPPVLFQIDTTGSIIHTQTLSNAANYDWEDITQDDEGRIYIGDFGNNKNNRKSLQIYIISDSENLYSERVETEQITFSFKDQTSFPPPPSQMNYDIEAMIFREGSIYLFSKNNTVPYSGYTKIYKIPSAPGNYVAELVDSLLIDTNSALVNSITGAATSPDKKLIALITYEKVYLIENLVGDNFSNADIIPISLPFVSQKEGITFKNNTEVFISDENFKGLIGGKLYLLNLTQFIPNRSSN